MKFRIIVNDMYLKSDFSTLTDSKNDEDIFEEVNTEFCKDKFSIFLTDYIHLKNSFGEDVKKGTLFFVKHDKSLKIKNISIIDVNVLYLSVVDGKVEFTEELNPHVKIKFEYVYEEEKQKVAFFYLFGYGCTRQTDIQFKNILHSIIHIPNDDINVLCNTNNTSGVYNIAKRIFGVKPSKRDEHVLFVMNLIKQKIDSGYKVYLYGQSLGGLFASTIGQIIEPRYLSNLYIATFGSIYIIPKREKLNIKQYIAVGDVCVRTNSIREPNINDSRFVTLLHNDLQNVSKPLIPFYLFNGDKYRERYFDDEIQNVTWIDFRSTSEEQIKVTSTKKSILPVKEEWEIHTSYDNIMVILAIAQSNDITHINVPFMRNRSLNSHINELYYLLQTNQV